MLPNCSMATARVFSHAAALRRISYLQSIFRIVGQQVENPFVHASPAGERKSEAIGPRRGRQRPLLLNIVSTISLL